MAAGYNSCISGYYSDLFVSRENTLQQGDQIKCCSYERDFEVFSEIFMERPEKSTVCDHQIYSLFLQCPFMSLFRRC